MDQVIPFSQAMDLLCSSHPKYNNSSLPLIGHAYILGRTPVEALHKQRRRHGDIFRLDSGPWPTVYICGYKLISEALKSDVFANRPHDATRSPGWHRACKFPIKVVT